MRVHVDRSRCRGYGMCTETAPSVFRFDDEGYAAADDRELSPAEIEAVRLAARLCPERAIVSDED